MNLAAVSSDAVIVRSTIDLAHNLGLTVVAEGVEDEVALGMLIEYGCDGAQGYLFNRPCPAAELTTWLTESASGAAVTEAPTVRTGTPSARSAGV
jgi:EAL domain-containing protein (putative c-di-GMP-specific phosphodiesterase class I)